jgi:hypothetical protein
MVEERLPAPPGPGEIPWASCALIAGNLCSLFSRLRLQ